MSEIKEEGINIITVKVSEKQENSCEEKCDMTSTGDVRLIAIGDDSIQLKFNKNAKVANIKDAIVVHVVSQNLAKENISDEQIAMSLCSIKILPENPEERLVTDETAILYFDEETELQDGKYKVKTRDIFENLTENSFMMFT